MKTNALRFIFWLSACIEENAYFGWNFCPRSDAELIADILILIFLALCVEIE